MHDAIHRYHDGTKHHFHRFAPSLGYLDWASQPSPFRSFHDAPAIALQPRPDAGAATADIGAVLRFALGLSAWKRNQWARWSLRVNPSSGNLHPTEAYVIAGPIRGISERAGVYHYSPDRHAIETRCLFDEAAWRGAIADPRTLLVALVSIHWREAWKYGERAFRYCQHDLGHAVAAVSIAGALDGWHTTMLHDWPQREIASLVGLDRDGDFFEAEREEPGCLLALTRRDGAGDVRAPVVRREPLLAAARGGSWTGRASQLSEDHVQWTFIDAITAATEDPGRDARASTLREPQGRPEHRRRTTSSARTALESPLTLSLSKDEHPGLLERLILQRRSALALDGRVSITRDGFCRMLSATMPSDAAPWQALWWDARIHLAIFVHRVDGLVPGLYALIRNASAFDRVKASCRPDFLWERVHAALPLFRLARGECRSLAGRLSCDQAIAADGFFSLGMLAEFDGSLDSFGPSFYRHLFWESGVVGQTLYLAAEASGARGTGIGCFYDDPVHDVLGIADHAFQSLYHFAVGMPVDDPRVTSERGYEWES